MSSRSAEERQHGSGQQMLQQKRKEQRQRQRQRQRQQIQHPWIQHPWQQLQHPRQRPWQQFLEWQQLKPHLLKQQQKQKAMQMH